MKKPAPKPKPRPGQVNPGGPMQAAPAPAAKAHHHHPAPKPGQRVNPGGPMKPAKTPARTVAKKKPRKPPPRKLALAEGVACCAAEALAASLRLTGWPVADDDVLALYWRTAADPDAGATISATLEAAREYGLAGVRPAAFCAAESDDLHQRHLFDHAGQVLGVAVSVPKDSAALAAAQSVRPVRVADDQVIHAGSLILGVDLPGSHAVLATPGGWWSWGEPYDPATWPDAVIEEAWEVTWCAG